MSAPSIASGTVASAQAESGQPKDVIRSRGQRLDGRSYNPKLMDDEHAMAVRLAVGARRGTARPSREPAPSSAGPTAARSAGGCRAIGAAIVALLAKFKTLLLLLPKLKLLASTGTMLVSIAAYALLWGWPFAAGFIVLLLVHEMGHVIALRREGIKASAPMFIPFLGAVIAARSLGDNALAEARVGLAGPDSRQHRLGRLHRRLARHRQRPVARAGVHRLLPQPLQPAAGGAARRRPGDGGDGAVDVVRRLRRDDRARDHLPEPDHPDDRAVRRLRDLPALEAAPRGRPRAAGVLPRQSARPGARRRRLPRPGRAAGGRHARHAAWRARSANPPRHGVAVAPCSRATQKVQTESRRPRRETPCDGRIEPR